MTHLWPYNGTLDAAGKVLTLDSEGPSFSGDGTMAKYQDIIEFIGDDHRTLSSQIARAGREVDSVHEDPLSPEKLSRDVLRTSYEAKSAV
jgi:hypothetical protein